MTSDLKIAFRVIQRLETNKMEITEKWWCLYRETTDTKTGKSVSLKEVGRFRDPKEAEKARRMFVATTPREHLLNPREHDSVHKEIVAREPTNSEILSALRDLLKNAVGIPEEKIHEAVKRAMTPKVFRVKPPEELPGRPEAIRAWSAPEGAPPILPAILTVE